MAKEPFRLKPKWPGDFACPHCGQEFMWDENNLYSFTFEWVVCPKCEGEFYVREVVKTTYDIAVTLNDDEEK